ncbi:MAG TPA: acid phosphatase [Usitatibacter sp.]|nr:acid phosphatase [Usitatibacter sp.]
MRFKTLVPVIALLVAGCAAQEATRKSALDEVQTIVVIYAENHSFDNMYGMFPGANGIAEASDVSKQQRDHDGSVMPHLPPVFKADKPDPAYPAILPNGPFRIDAPPVGKHINELTPGPIHLYYQNIEQIDGGRNDKFVAMTNVGGWVMGYYDGSHQKVWQWAQRYTLADNYFMGAFGGSFLNHQWLICACTPTWKNAPASIRAQLDASGHLKRKPGSPASAMDGPARLYDGQVTPDGFAVNTSQPAYEPSGIPPAPGGNPDFADPAKNVVPPQTQKTIGDTLSANGVTWAWYGGAWNQALADGRQPPQEKRSVIYTRAPGSPNFQPHHQPFNYFANYAPGTVARAEHLKDGDDLMNAIDTGSLPQVSFYKPPGVLTQHPSYTDIQSGDIHIDDLLSRLEASPQWPHMMVIVTYDENGGYWDHVAPPSGEGWGDRWGPGSRVPAIIVSPLARHGYVDHTSYDTTSILKLITRRFGLEPLPGVRRNAGDLTNALEAR